MAIVLTLGCLYQKLSKAIPINELTGGPQPPILGASESSTPPELGAGGPPVDLLLGIT